MCGGDAGRFGAKCEDANGVIFEEISEIGGGGG